MRNGQRTDDGNDREVKTSRPEAMRRADSERFREFALNTPRAIHLHTVPRRHRHASQSPWNLKGKGIHRRINPYTAAIWVDMGGLDIE